MSPQERKRVRILYVPGKGWCWYITPLPHERSHQVNGYFVTYEEAKVAVREEHHG